MEHVELDDAPPYPATPLARYVFAALFLLRRFAWVTRFDERDRRARAALSGRTWDVIVANDVGSLPLAMSLTARGGVLADVHEYATRQEEHSKMWRLVTAPYMRWLVRTFLTKADRVTTVSSGLASEYLSEFGIACDVVCNASAYRELVPTPTHNTLRLVHSGIVAPQRRLELMVEGVRASSADVTLDFYLMHSESAAMQHLRDAAGDDPRIRFNDPVAPEQLPETLNQYDVGLGIFPPTTFNLAHCLPNKFFDFVQARLGVIVGPSPEMAREVTLRGFGAVLDDFTAESLTRTLNTITPEMVQTWIQAAHLASRPLAAEEQLATLSRVVADLADGSAVRDAQV